MFALILHPAAAPQEVAVADLNLCDESAGGCLGRWQLAAQLLEQEPAQVGVMEAGVDFIIYRQCQGARNPAAEQLLPRFLIGEVFGQEDDDQCRIYGPVVILTCRADVRLPAPAQDLQDFRRAGLLGLAWCQLWGRG